jgi:NAD(P)-dependent dehydrogenase (short-subunit alcohol dehydrogenase family)
MTSSSDALFRLDGRVAVVTGASGTIGRAFAQAVASAGAHVALLARRAEPLKELAEDLAASGAEVATWSADVRKPDALETVRDQVLARFGRVDVILHAVGGNVAHATVADDADPLSVGLEAYRDVLDLNLLSTVAVVEAFGPALADGRGEDRSIVTVSSMAAGRALTRVGGYGAAKAAVEGLTRWLAVELARRGTGIRVNAIAPGFFVGEQNRRLLLEPDGSLTARGHVIIEQTPAGRFGDVTDLVSTALWLCGPGARFVTGVVVPVDGGFSAYGGV